MQSAGQARLGRDLRTKQTSESELVVDSFTPIAIKRVLVTLTRQLVVRHGEVCECSQLAKLGWDAI